MAEGQNYTFVFYSERQPRNLLGQLSAAQFVNWEYMAMFVVMLLLIVMCAYVCPGHLAELSSPIVMDVSPRSRVTTEQRTRLLVAESDWRRTLRRQRKWCELGGLFRKRL